MKNIRKLLAVLLLVSLTLGTSYACADTNISESGEQIATTSVVLDLGEQPTSYTIVIPSQVTIDPSTGNGETTITLQSGFVLTDVTSLQVRMTGGYTYSTQTINGSYTAASMNLRNSANDSSVICSITRATGSSTKITHSTPLISVTNTMDNNMDYSETLRFKVGSMPSYGKYTGSLTFSVITE